MEVSMFRNKEFRYLLMASSILTLINIIICYNINLFVGSMVMLTDILFIGITIFFTKRRYREIEKLSGYLRRIYNGDYSLDIRDNTEGELSILKNEIYKVTLILSKQAELLQSEKEQLADALSDISHQLKTPLTSMMVMSELLNNDELDKERRKEFTKNLELQFKRMEWLLTSLLKLSKLDAGTVEFKLERIQVSKLVKQALKPVLIPMELKEQKLLINGEDEVSFLGDFNWTTEALINLLKNCMEHTPVGGTISISYEENPIFTQIIISDNGSGIDQHDLPYIFKRFYKGKNASEDSVGIGLAMAKSIITNQNGDINVTSKINTGTQFCIKFFKQIS